MGSPKGKRSLVRNFKISETGVSHRVSDGSKDVLGRNWSEFITGPVAGIIRGLIWNTSLLVWSYCENSLDLACLWV